METFLFDWDHISDKGVFNSTLGSNINEELTAQFRGAALLMFIERYKDEVQGFTFEGSESENQLGLSDRDKNFLEKNGVKLEFGEKPGCIYIRSIKRFIDPIE